MEAFLRILLILSLSGTALALLLALLRRILGGCLPSAFYYWGWLLVTLRFLLPLPGLLPAAGEQAADYPLPEPTVYAEPIRAWQPDVADYGGPALPEPTATPAAAPVQRDEPSAPAARHGLDPAALLKRVGRLIREPGFWLRLWVLGAAASAAWYALGYRRFRRGLRETLRPPLPSDLAVYDTLAAPRRPTLYRSAGVDTPMLLGLFRPVLVLPDRSYDDAMLEGILRHELTHYRRGDVAVKWLAALAGVIHWFNPVTRLLTRELDRACELACDERLLRQMDAAEKRRYGELLLSLAADRKLPRSVVATSFAIEKRNLKERLVQIMTYKKRGRATLALTLAALLLLTGCAGALGPAEQPSPAESAPPQESAPLDVPPTPEAAEAPSAVEGPETPDENYSSTVTVKTVDELLAAIAPHTRILLEPGFYDLSTASDYGKAYEEGYYTWEDCYDGCQLVIRKVDWLAIQGSGAEDVTIAAQPRYANVLAFQSCGYPLVTGITAGHTPEPAICAGGVLDFETCQGARVLDCGLFGCGILGVNARNTRGLSVKNTAIYDCSYGAVTAVGSYDVLVEDCDIYDCGRKDEYGFTAFYLLQAQSTTGFAIVNTKIRDNSTMILLDSRYSREVCLLGCEISNNEISGSVFSIEGASPVVDGCSFTKNRDTDTGDKARFYPVEYSGYAVDRNGEDLISFDLERMSWHKAAYEGIESPEPVLIEPSTEADGTQAYHVKTVDEFLAAIGPDTTIYLDAELFKLSDASSYGGYGSLYYYWSERYDGPSLVIANVSNLRIVGQGKDKTTLLTEPRYADVLSFTGGENITLEGFTAGHTDTGYCSGDVLGFEAVTNLSIRDCGLFGCGVWGLRANMCYNVSVDDTEIYSCSQGALTLYDCGQVSLNALDIHDMPSPETAWLDSCRDVSLDGKALPNGSLRL